MIKRTNNEFDTDDTTFGERKESKATKRPVNQRAELDRLDQSEFSTTLPSFGDAYKRGIVELGAITKESALYGGTPITMDSFSVLGAPKTSSFSSVTGLSKTGHVSINALRNVRNALYNIDVKPFRSHPPPADTDTYAKLMHEFNESVGIKVYKSLKMRHDDDERVKWPNMTPDELLKPVVHQQMLEYYEVEDGEKPPLNNNFQRWGSMVATYPLNSDGSLQRGETTQYYFKNSFRGRKQDGFLLKNVASEVIVQGEETLNGALRYPQLSDAALFARKLQYVGNMTCSGNGTPRALVQRTGTVIKHSLEYRADYIRKPDEAAGITDAKLFAFWRKHSPRTDYYSDFRKPNGLMGLATIKAFATKITAQCREAGIQSPFVINVNSTAGPPYPENDNVKKLQVYLASIQSADKLLRVCSQLSRITKDFDFLREKAAKAKDEPMTRDEYDEKRRAIYVENAHVSIPAAIAIRMFFSKAPNFITYSGPEEDRPHTLKGINLSNGGIITLIRTAIKHLLATKKREILLTFADNLYVFAIYDVGGKDELHWWSLDGVKWESAANPATYAKFMRYVLSAFDHELPCDDNNVPTGIIPDDPSFSALKAGWARYLLDLYPKVACEPILNFAGIQIPANLLSSGSAGTLEFNDANMQRLKFIFEETKTKGDYFVDITGGFSASAQRAMKIACARVQVESEVNGKHVSTKIADWSNSANQVFLSFAETIMTAPARMLKMDLLGHDLFSVAHMTGRPFDAVAQLREGKLLTATANSSVREDAEEDEDGALSQYTVGISKAKSLYLTSFARPGADVFFERAVSLYLDKLADVPGGLQTARFIVSAIPENLEGVVDDDVVQANVEALSALNLPTVYSALRVMGGREMANAFLDYVLTDYSLSFVNKRKGKQARNEKLFGYTAEAVWRLIPPYILIPLQQEDSRVPPTPKWVKDNSKYEEWSRTQLEPDFSFDELIPSGWAHEGDFGDVAMRNVRKGVPGEPVSHIDGDNPTMLGVHATNVDTVWASMTPRQQELSKVRAAQIMRKIDSLLSVRDAASRQIVLPQKGDFSLGNLTGRFITKIARGMGVPVKALRMHQKLLGKDIFAVSPALGISEDTIIRALVDVFPRDSILPVEPKDKLPGHPDRKPVTFAKVEKKKEPKTEKIRQTQAQAEDRKTARAVRVEKAKLKKEAFETYEPVPVKVETADPSEIQAKRLNSLHEALRSAEVKRELVRGRISEAEAKSQPANQDRSDLKQLDKKISSINENIARVSALLDHDSGPERGVGGGPELGAPAEDGKRETAAVETFD